jgi:uncharacterized protein YjgD (DUF1641 family)
LVGLKTVGSLRKGGSLPSTIVDRGSPRIPVDSPLETTLAANPIAAETLAAKAVLEPTGKWAEAAGAEKGQIIHDWVFHDVIPPEVQKAKPDLIKALKDSEADIKATFSRTRYDPHIINVTEREAEVAQILQLTKESSLPHYNDAMSLITETDSLFQGNAVFGRNSTGGYTKVKDARVAYDNLKHAIDQLPPELQGELGIVKYDNQHYLNWQWKREYDPIADKIFSKESINTTVLGGKDASWLARSWAGKHLFATGRFPSWVENSALSNIDIQAGINAQLTSIIRSKIVSTKHPKELDHLINYAEEKGLNYISEAQISSMHPKLSTKEVADLFETHTWWNQLQTYNHNFLNRARRKDLVDRNMEGLYDKDGNYLGAASLKVGEAELSKVTDIWDFDKNVSVPYNREVVEASGRKPIRLADEIEDQGKFYSYGLTGTNANVNLLPKVVLPKLPGYSGRRVMESYYVDIVPKKRVTNGVSETDPKGLVQYTRTKAASRNRHEGEKIAEQLQAKYPDHIVIVRPERTEGFGRVLTDYQIHEESLRHSMKRGERLPSLNGPARLEDRMITLLDNVKTVSRVGAFNAWDEAFRSSFVKGYPEFLHNGKFPEYKTELTFNKVPKTLENEKAYKTAHQLWDQYSMMKNMETRGDFIWTEGLHGIADILESWKVPQGVVDKFRGKHTNPLMIGKTVATTAYIYLHPGRQLFIQTLPQQLEMYALNPKTAARTLQNTLALRTYLALDAKIMSGYKDILQPSMAKIMEKTGNKDFLKDAQAIRESGLLDSADMNSIVHGVFKEVDRGLVESLPEQVYRDIAATVKALPRAARTVGFDLAEVTNRVGNWLQAKNMWIEQHPNKSWETREAKATIAAEASKLSGAMNRAASLPMQRGVFSVIAQFTAIQQKMLFSLLQDNGTILTSNQRLRLAAVRAGMYGAELGIPGGVIAYYLIDKSDNETIKENADIIRRGLVDKSTNAMLRALVEGEENIDLSPSKSMSPYSEGFLPYLQLAYEARKLMDGKPEGPRYPVIGILSSFYQAIDDMRGWYRTKEVSEGTAKQMFLEAAELASGMNSYQKGLVMLGMKDKVTTMGNKYGLEFTAAEAYARMFVGIPSMKEEQLFKLIELEKNPKERKKELASFIHKQLVNQEIKAGVQFSEADKIKRIASFMNVISSDYFTEADKAEVVSQVYKMDEFSYRTVKSSVMANLIKNRQQELTEDSRVTLDILHKLRDPETQKVLEILKDEK